MQSFKVKDGKVIINGVIYGPSPKDDIVIKGPSGRIQSVTIPGRGQFFPIGGSYIDPLVADEPETKPKTKKGKG